METNFSKMVKRQKNKLTKEKWDKNCGIWKKIKITKKKEFDKRIWKKRNNATQK